MAAADLRPALPGLACRRWWSAARAMPSHAAGMFARAEMAAAIPGARLEWLPSAGTC